jgi:predicted phosphodiesterase
VKVALVADIHGNGVALDAVLADLERRAVDRCICLGDVAAIGPSPVEVLDRVRSLAWPVVMGNTDEWLLEPPDARDDDHRRLSELVHWARERLQETDLDYVQRFEPTIEVSLDGGGDLLCFHGSPRSNSEGLLAETPAPALDEMLAGADASLLAGGHTHVPMIRRHRRATIVNPGSVGLAIASVPAAPAWPPAKAKPDYGKAEYAVVEDGCVELVRVKVDADQVRDAVSGSGMPNAEWWLGG